MPFLAVAVFRDRPSQRRDPQTHADMRQEAVLWVEFSQEPDVRTTLQPVSLHPREDEVAWCTSPWEATRHPGLRDKQVKSTSRDIFFLRISLRRRSVNIAPRSLKNC